jgi:BirA family transcriptional regulator, biotin operon repressor / biotin---[acetyl-CoA-carboxylase] ligase
VNGFDIEQVKSRLAAGELTWSLRYEPVCSSTQDLARAAAAEGVDQGLVVITDEQHAGRGRLGRAWLAPPGTALLFSVVLRPPVDLIALLPLMAGVVIAGGIESATGARTDLKWPNDVLLSDRKLAGILLEHPAGSAVILGVGVNVSQSVDQLPPGATSLLVDLGRAVDRESLLAAILNDLGNDYERADREGVDWIVPAWRSRSGMLGRPVRVNREGAITQGIAEDIAPDGGLVVRLADGQRLSVVAGEVEQVRSIQS